MSCNYEDSWSVAADDVGDGQQGAPAGELGEDVGLAVGVDRADGVDHDGDLAAAVEQAEHGRLDAIIGRDAVDDERRPVAVVEGDDRVGLGV